MALKATICGMDYSTKAIYTSFQQKSPETRAFTHTLKKFHIRHKPWICFYNHRQNCGDSARTIPLFHQYIINFSISLNCFPMDS